MGCYPPPRSVGRVSPNVVKTLAPHYAQLRRAFLLKRWVGKAPLGREKLRGTVVVMNSIILILVLLILFGGGGFYLGGPAFGGGGLGLILLICLIVWMFGGFRTRS